MGKGMYDTGCGKLCCGLVWYQHYLQHVLPKLDLRSFQYAEQEYFKFGPGERIASLFGVVLPVAVKGVCFGIRVSVVPGQVPLLLSHSFMDTLDMWYGARRLLLYVGAFGLEVILQRTSGHPLLDLTDFPPAGFDVQVDVSDTPSEVRLSHDQLRHADRRSRVPVGPSEMPPAVRSCIESTRQVDLKPQVGGVGKAASTADGKYRR